MDISKQEHKLTIQWMEKQLQLTQRRSVLEKDRSIYLSKDFTSINLESQKNEEKIRRHLDDVKKKLEKMKVLLKHLKCIIKDENIFEYRQSETNLQDIIEQLENQITMFHQEQLQISNELIREERVYDREVAQYEILFEKWVNEECSIKVHQEPKVKSSKRENAANIPSNTVQEAVEKLEKHKSLSKWHEVEERVFLKLLQKYSIVDGPHGLIDDSAKNSKKIVRFIDKASIDIPMKSTTAIEEHLQWHKEYRLLLKEHREAIAKWKEEKIKAKEQIKEAISLQDESTTITKINTSKNRTLDPAECRKEELKKQSLLEWKEEKLRRERVKEEEELQKKEKRSSVNSVEQQRRLETKQKLALYHLQKEQELNRKMQVESMNEIKKVKDNGSLERKSLYERDMRLMREKKLKKKEEKKSEEKEKKDNETKKVIGIRDPNRLFQYTQAFREHCISKESLIQREADRQRQGAHEDIVPCGDVACQAKGLSFGHMPIQQRATPSWRKPPV